MVRDGRAGLEVSWSAGLSTNTWHVEHEGPLAGPLRDQFVVDWLVGPSLPLLVVRDRTTLRRLIEQLGRRGPGDDTQARTCAAQLRVVAGLPASARLAVLDRDLERALWRPSCVRPGDVSSWADALGLPDDWDGLAACTRIVATATPDAGQARYAEAVAWAEQQAVGVTDWRGGAVQAAGAFHAAQSVGGAWEAYLACDATYAPLAAATGDAPMLRALDSHGSRVRAQVSTPCRLRVGRDVRIVTSGGTGEAMLERLEFTDTDGLIGVFGSAASSRGRQSRGLAMLARQAACRGERETARVCAVPYLPRRRGRDFSPWLVRSADIPRAEREVPLDVSLAAGDV